MITVHHLENSRSQRVLWFLEELGVDYEIERYERDPETMLGPRSLYRIHPLGKSPVITDGDRTIAESGLIIEYLAAKYGGEAWQADPLTDRGRRVRYWLHYAEGSLMPLLLLKLMFSRMGKPPVPWLVRPVAGTVGAGVNARFVQPRLAAQLQFIDSELGVGPWFAGDSLSMADIQMSFPLEAAMARADTSECPNIGRFVDRVHSRDAYQRALEKGGPYDYA